MLSADLLSPLGRLRKTMGADARGERKEGAEGAGPTPKSPLAAAGETMSALTNDMFDRSRKLRQTMKTMMETRGGGGGAGRTERRAQGEGEGEEEEEPEEGQGGAEGRGKPKALARGNTSRLQRLLQRNKENVSEGEGGEKASRLKRRGRGGKEGEGQRDDESEHSDEQKEQEESR